MIIVERKFVVGPWIFMDGLIDGSATRFEKAAKVDLLGQWLASEIRYWMKTLNDKVGIIVWGAVLLKIIQMSSQYVLDSRFHGNIMYVYCGYNSC